MLPVVCNAVWFVILWKAIDVCEADWAEGASAGGQRSSTGGQRSPAAARGHCERASWQTTAGKEREQRKAPFKYNQKYDCTHKNINSDYTSNFSCIQYSYTERGFGILRSSLCLLPWSQAQSWLESSDNQIGTKRKARKGRYQDPAWVYINDGSQT